MEFHIYKDEAGEYRWRLKAANGNILADSGEGYKNKDDCITAINSVRSAELTVEDEQ